MSFLSPWWLLLLVAPLVLLAAYILAQRARRKYTVRFTSVDLLASVAPRRPGWQRHIPAVALLGALILLVLGVLCTAVAHTLFIEGMRDISAQLASLTGSVEPIWGIAIAMALLGEVPSGRTLAGGAVILAATLIPTVVALRPKGTGPDAVGLLR